MNDEEKKAIEYLKRHIIPCYGRKGTIEFMLNDIVLNLIKKQSKEIEELSDKLTEKICKGVEEEILEEYRQTIISKNKEIEELKEKNKTLKNLQNDTNGLYIEMIERKNYFERELQKLEAKIKAKIEEKFLEAKGLYERGVQPQAQYTMKLLRDLEKSLLEKE